MWDKTLVFIRIRFIAQRYGALLWILFQERTKKYNKVIMNKFIFSSLLLLLACSSEGPEGLRSLIDLTDEPAGINCLTGGQKITSGVDENRNDLLDQNEIEQTRYICNGKEGLSSVINSTPELAGDHCPYGGLKVESGVDTNANEQLDSFEIKQVRYLCNGEDGVTEKEIRFLLGPFGNYSGTLGGPYPSIFEFDIRNYPSVDSATFVIFGAGTYDSNGQPKVIESTFQLVDDTNGQAITNSTIVSDDIPAHEYKTSKNFISELPREKIRLRADIPTDPTSNIICQTSYLILVRE
ncbi:MAG: hypothetical protein WKF87_04000 [Chryseolinea sp.]